MVIKCKSIKEKLWSRTLMNTKAGKLLLLFALLYFHPHLNSSSFAISFHFYDTFFLYSLTFQVRPLTFRSPRKILEKLFTSRIFDENWFRNVFLYVFKYMKLDRVMKRCNKSSGKIKQLKDYTSEERSKWKISPLPFNT